MARRIIQKGGGLDPVPFRPTASPLGRPRLAPDSSARNLRQLAQGLGRFSSTLASLTDESIRRKGEEDREAGIQRARELQQEGLTFKEAVAKGLISPADSPWFRTGAEEFFGRNAASRYNDDLHNALRESGLTESSTDTADFDEFERNFREDWIEENVGEANRGVAFESAFGRTVDANTTNTRSAFNAAVGRNLVRDTGEAVHQSVVTTALDAHAGDMNPEAPANLIRMDIERARAMGVSNEIANKKAAQGIVNAYLDTGDEDLLDIMDHIQMGSGPMGNTSWAMDMKREARSIVDRREEADRKDDILDAEDAVLRAFKETGDFNAPEVQEAFDALSAVPGGARSLASVASSIRSFENSSEQADPDVVRALSYQAIDGTLSEGELHGYRTALDLPSYLQIRNIILDNKRREALAAKEAREASSVDEKDAVDDPVYKMYNSIGVDLLTGDDLMTKEEAGVVLARNQGDIIVNYTEWFTSGGWQQPIRVRQGVMQRLVAQVAKDDGQEGTTAAETGSRNILREAWADPRAMGDETFDRLDQSLQTGDFSNLSDEDHDVLRTLVPKPTAADIRILRDLQAQSRGRPTLFSTPSPTPEDSPSEEPEEPRERPRVTITARPGSGRRAEDLRRAAHYREEVEELRQEKAEAIARFQRIWGEDTQRTPLSVRKIDEEIAHLESRITDLESEDNR